MICQLPKIVYGELIKTLRNVYRWMEHHLGIFSLSQAIEIAWQYFSFSKRCFTEYIRWVLMKESCWMPFNSGQSFTSQKLKYRAENTKQAHRYPAQDDCGLPAITIRSEFLYLHPLKTILLLRNCSRPPHFKQSLKAWSNVASNLTRTVIWCVDKIWTSWIIVVCYMDNWRARGNPALQ